MIESAIKWLLVLGAVLALGAAIVAFAGVWASAGSLVESVHQGNLESFGFDNFRAFQGWLSASSQGMAVMFKAFYAVSIGFVALFVAAMAFRLSRVVFT